MAVVGEAQVRIVPDTANFGAEAESGILGGLSGIVAKGAAVLGGLFVAKEAVQGLSSLVDVGQQLSKQQELVNQAIKSTGDVSHTSAAGLQAFAAGQAAVTGNSVAQITQMQQVLLRFTNIQNQVGAGNDIFNQAEVAIQNVSAALGKGLQPTAIAVGKALQIPGTGLTSLQRLGIQFTDQQKDMVKALVASGDTLGAQQFILQSLAQRYGDAAAASATFTQKLDAELANAKALVGQSLEGALAALTTGLLPVIPEIGTVLAQAVNAVIPAITPALKTIGPVLESIVTGIAPILTGLGATVGQAFAGLAPVFNQIGVLLVSVSPLFKPIATEVGAMAQAFSAIATPALQGFISIVDSIVKAVLPPLTSALNTLAPIIVEVSHIFGDTLGAALDDLAPVLGQIAGLLGSAFADALRSIAPVLPPIAQFLAELGAFAAQAAQSFLSALVPGIQALANAIAPILPVLGNLATSLGTQLVQALISIEPAIVQIVTLLGTTFARALTALAPVLPTLAQAFGNLAIAFTKLLVAAAPAVVQLVDLGSAILTSVGVPTIVALATAFTDLANAILPLISNVNVLEPLLIFLGTLWAVDKIVVFIQTIEDVTAAVVAFFSALQAGRITDFVSSFISFGTAGASTATVMETSAARIVAAQADVDAAIAASDSAVLDLLGAEFAEEEAAAAVATAQARQAEVLAQIASIKADLAAGTLDAAEAEQLQASAENFLTGATERLTAAQEALAAAQAQVTESSGAADVALAQQESTLGALAAAEASVDAISFAALAGTIGVAVAAFVAVLFAANELFDVLQRIGGVAEAAGVTLGVILAPFTVAQLVVIRNFSTILGFFESLPGVVAGAGSAIGSFFATIGSAIGSGVTTGVGAVVGFFEALPGEIASALTTAGSAIASFFVALGPDIVSALGAALEAVVGALPGISAAVIQFFADLPAKMVAPLAFTAGFIVGALARAAVDTAEALPALFAAVVGFFESLPKRIADAVATSASALGNVGAEILDTIATGLTSGVPVVVDAVVNEFDALPGQIASVMSSIPGLIASSLSSVGSSIGGALGSAGSAVGGALGGVGSSIGSALSTAGAAAINGLVTGAQAAFGAVQTFFGNLPGQIISVLPPAITWLQQVGQDVLNGLIFGIETAAASIGNFFVTIVQKFVQGFEAAFGIASPAATMIPIGENILLGIVQGALDAVGSLLAFIGSLPGRVVAAAANFSGVMAALGVSLISGIVGGAQNSVGNLLALFGGLPGRLASDALAGLGLFLNVGRSFVSSVASGATAAFGTLLSFFERLPSSILSSIGNVASQFFDIGTQIVQGIVQGIASAPSIVESALSSLLGGAVNFAKGLLGISSPSEVFASQVGVPIAQGIALGMNEGASTATAAVRQLIAQLGDTSKTALDTAFDPNATIAAAAAAQSQIAAAIAANPAIGKAFTQVGTDATNAFNNAIKDKKSDINATLADLGQAALPKIKTGDVQDALAFFVGLNNASKGTAAQLAGIDNVVATLQNLNLSSATVGSQQFASALELVAAKGQQLGLSGPAVDTFRDHVLAAAGATAPQIKTIDDNMQALEFTLGKPLSAQQITDIANATGDLANAVPGTQQFTTAIGNINQEASKLGLGGQFLQAFQQDALGLGGAPVTSTNALKNAMAQLAITASGSVATFKENMESALTATGAVGAAFPKTFSNITDFVLQLSGASLQAEQAQQQLATSTLNSAQATVQATGDTKQASTIIDQGVSSLVAMASHLGLTGAAAVQYAAALLGIPASKATTITTNAQLEQALIDTYKAHVDAIQKNVTTTISADDQVTRTIGTIETGLNRLSNTTTFVHIGAKIIASPERFFDDWGAAISYLVSAVQGHIENAPNPLLAVTMDRALIAGAPTSLSASGAMVSSIVQKSLAPVSLVATASIGISPNAEKEAAVQLQGTLDQLVSSATGALPTVANAVSNFMQAYSNAFDAASKANAAFTAANNKLIADQKAAVDTATIFLDTDAVNKAAAAQQQAHEKLVAAADPKNFVATLQQQNDQVQQLQADLTKILREGNTALAAELAQQGTSGLKLAQVFASDASAAAQAEKALAAGQSLQDKFSQFLTTTFGPDFAGAAASAGTSAADALTQAMSDGLLGVIPAARAIVGQLASVLSDSAISSGFNQQISAVQTQLTQLQLTPQQTSQGAVAAVAVTPVAAQPAAQSPINVTLNIEIQNEDGSTSTVTVPVTVPVNPTRIVQSVQAKARVQ